MSPQRAIPLLQVLVKAQVSLHLHRLQRVLRDQQVVQHPGRLQDQRQGLHLNRHRKAPQSLRQRQNLRVVQLQVRPQGVRVVVRRGRRLVAPLAVLRAVRAARLQVQPQSRLLRARLSALRPLRVRVGRRLVAPLGLHQGQLVKAQAIHRQQVRAQVVQPVARLVVLLVAPHRVLLLALPARARQKAQVTLLQPQSQPQALQARVLVSQRRPRQESRDQLVRVHPKVPLEAPVNPRLGRLVSLPQHRRALLALLVALRQGQLREVPVGAHQGRHQKARPLVLLRQKVRQEVPLVVQARVLVNRPVYPHRPLRARREVPADQLVVRHLHLLVKVLVHRHRKAQARLV